MRRLRRTVGLVLLAMGWWPLSAAAGAQPHMIFGSVGIVAGQTARLNVVNVYPPDPGAPACVVELGFVDGSDQALLPAVRVTLGGGQSAFLDFPASERGQRLQLRGVINTSAPGNPDRGACRSVVATVEIFETASGITMILQNPLMLRGQGPGTPDLPVGRR